jgi:hypothetical protein
LTGFAGRRALLRGVSAPSTGDCFERFERELHVAMCGIEKELVREQRLRLDVGEDSVRIGSKVYRRVAGSDTTYVTAAGPVSVSRHLFEAKGERHAICPVELRAAIVEGEYTPRAARLMALMMSEMPSAQAKAIFKEFGSMKPRLPGVEIASSATGARGGGSRSSCSARPSRANHRPRSNLGTSGGRASGIRLGD